MLGEDYKFAYLEAFGGFEEGEEVGMDVVDEEDDEDEEDEEEEEEFDEGSEN